MTALETQTSIFELTETTTNNALAIFDRLDPVDLDFMMGRWKGAELRTNHPMDGMLEASDWFGKEFVDPETVHPLLFLDGQGNIIKVAPNPMAMDWALGLVLKFPTPSPSSSSTASSTADLGWMKPLFKILNTFLQTDKSQARLRMMEYRGKVGATMIYDQLPINDAFRKIDDNNVLGVMDFKALPQPYFFKLTRCLGE